MSAEEYAKGRYGGVSNDPSNSSYQLGLAERTAYNSSNYRVSEARTGFADPSAHPGKPIRLPRWFVRTVVVGVVGYYAATSVHGAWLDGAGAAAVLHGLPAIAIGIGAHAGPRLQDAFEYLCLVVFWVWAALKALQWSGFSF